MTLIIAEAGINHNGDISLAKEMIDTAVFAKADAVKFQTFDAVKLEPPGPMRELLARVQLSRDDHRILKDYCGDRIEFMSTPFDVGSLEFLVGLGVKRLKIASGNLNNWKLLRAADRSGVSEILISTGAATIDQIVAAGNYMELNSPTMMHCVSAYPIPPEEANLWVIETQRQYCGGRWGLSDHTLGITAPVMAVALGASVIEKHFTMNRELPGPDHKMALGPVDLMKMVAAVREAEAMLGDGCKRLMPCEQGTMETIERRRAWANR